MTKPYRSLNLDPGTTNAGWSCLEFQTKARMRIVRCGMLKHMIKELTGGQTKAMALAYRKEICYIVKKSRPDAICAERYVPRRQGLANESINYMLGFLLGTFSHTEIDFYLWLAATWKVALKKIMDIEAFYVQCKPVPDHVVDSVLIGIFTAGKCNRFNVNKLGSKHFLKQLERMIKGAYK